MGWELLTADQREGIVAETQRRYRWTGLTPGALLDALDGEVWYMRYHADLSEPTRALWPVAMWFGIHLARQGWQWAKDSSDAIGVISPDGHTGCALVELTGTLFYEDAAPVFSTLATLLEDGIPVELNGIVHFP